jgi:uncharacterized membrane protein YeaQ/YmgE (transglycosylase-associated protein family)
MEYVLEFGSYLLAGVVAALLHKLIFKPEKGLAGNIFLGFVLALVFSLALNLAAAGKGFPFWLAALISVPVSFLFLWYMSALQKKAERKRQEQ